MYLRLIVGNAFGNLGEMSVHREDSGAGMPDLDEKPKSETDLFVLVSTIGLTLIRREGETVSGR
jgi:hypothetical protein